MRQTHRCLSHSSLSALTDLSLVQGGFFTMDAPPMHNGMPWTELPLHRWLNVCGFSHIFGLPATLKFMSMKKTMLLHLRDFFTGPRGSLQTPLFDCGHGPTGATRSSQASCPRSAFARDVSSGLSGPLRSLHMRSVETQCLEVARLADRSMRRPEENEAVVRRASSPLYGQGAVIKAFFNALQAGQHRRAQSTLDNLPHMSSVDTRSAGSAVPPHRSVTSQRDCFP
ncbi:hypothetical protein C8Q77DRAFT_1101915 [Trametes polyzona]|nr:hypothetical protein C8Q77DRAFT_1101915 [Trametes polyzona]